MNVSSPLPTAFTALPAPVEDSAQLPMLRQYLRIVARRRWVIIGATLGILLLGLIVTMLMSPKYTAISAIEISREAGNVTNIQGVEREANIADQEFYQTQYGLLKSRVLSERVARELGLIDDRNFFEMFGGAPEDPAFELVNGRFRPQGRPERQRIAGEILLKNLIVDPARLSRLVYIHFTSREAEFSAKVANSWAKNYIQTNLERKVQATSYGRDLLERELAKTKEKLDQSQRLLVDYASTQQIINLPGQSGPDGRGQERSLVADTLSQLGAELSKATADRIDAEARFAQTQRAGSSTESLTNPAINRLRERRAELSADYQKLMEQFEPGYPAARALKSQIDDLDQALGREEGRVSGALRAQYRQAEQREEELRQRVDALKSDYLDLRRRSIQYNIYQQEVDTNRVLYDGLLQRYKEIGVAGGVGVNNVSIVDPADVPQEPSSPRLLLNLLVSLLAGMVLGGLAAFALEQIDEAIADPDEVERLLGLPLLGTVPRIDGEEPREALLDRKSELVDAYLAVQTNLSFTTDHGVPRSFSVTSTRPAEGKSTTALSLATTLARSGRRVVLIDGDMRSPSVHQLNGVKNDRGLSNFLTGQDAIDELLFRIEDLNLHAIAAGPIPPNAAELLTSDRLRVLIERLLERFDQVVVDSPPVMGLADAPLIASKVEGVIYAVESHGVRSSMVTSALSRLRSANARVIGCVLTKFEAHRSNYGYNYGYGYGRDARTANENS